MASQRQRVLTGMVGAALFSALFIYAGMRWWPFAMPQAASAGERLAFALRCEIFVMLMLLLGIGNVARQRFFSETAIDGSAPGAASSIDINCRYVQNTAEQCLLAVVGHLALAMLVPVTALAAIPVLVALFVFARICFWVGYHHSPISRAFGFAATFYPTIGVYVLVIYLALA